MSLACNLLSNYYESIMKLLILNSSILGEQSASAKLTRHFAELWKQPNNQRTVTTRDLAVDSLPPLTAQSMTAWSTPYDQQTEEQKRLTNASDGLIEQVKAHDVLVVAAPLYNLSIPIELKNAQDNLARTGVTFRYTANGAEGLLGQGKKVIIVHTCGGIFKDTPADSVTPMLDHYFGFLGFRHISHVWAEGLSIDDAKAQEAMASAKDELEQLMLSIHHDFSV